MFPVHPHHVATPGVHENLSVRPGNTIDATFKCHNKVFSVKCDGIVRKLPSFLYKSSNANSNSHQQYHPFYVHATEILALNDLHLNASLCKGIEKLIASMQQQDLPLNIMFLPESLTLLPLQTIKLGADNIMVLGMSKTDLAVYKRVAMLNDIHEKKMTLKSLKETLEEVAHTIRQQDIDGGDEDRPSWAGLVLDPVEHWLGCSLSLMIFFNDFIIIIILIL